MPTECCHSQLPRPVEGSAGEKRATAKDLWEKNSTSLHFQLILEMTFTAIRKPKTWDKRM